MVMGKKDKPWDEALEEFPAPHSFKNPKSFHPMMHLKVFGSFNEIQE